MQTEYSKKDSHLINNDYYHDLAERWYTATDDPIALLRAESRLRNSWISHRIDSLYQDRPSESLKVLDVGCGAGFLSNALAADSYQVTGVDLSESSLQIARAKDASASVNYIQADAYALPFADASFDVITSTDFLEHVSEPQKVLAEIHRCLEPGGYFFFHTFNKNKLAELLVIKSLELFVKNTPKNLHVIDLFIKPEDLKSWMADLGLITLEIHGVRPVIFQLPLLKLIFTGHISPDFRFCWTKSLRISYTGVARRAD